MIYEHRDTLIARGGSTVTTTLSVVHGLVRQLLVQSSSNGTVFMVTFTDSNGLVRRKSQVVTAEYNDVSFFPISGICHVDVLNASSADTFKIYVGVEE